MESSDAAIPANTSPVDWKYCPPEILLMIFEWLDVKTLINCMVVCRKWWDLTSNIVQHIGWERLAELTLSDKAASYRKKSKMNFHDAILNLSLWQDIYLATPQDSFNYDVNGVISINVYKHFLIVVTHWDVKYFNYETNRLVKTLPLTCIDFDENDHMYLRVELTFDSDAKISKYRTLTLYGKQGDNSSIDEEITFTHQSVLYYRLHENSCYFTISEYCIFVATWSKDNWITQLVARYFGFGKIIDIGVYQNDILALLNWGGVLQVSHGSVKFKLNKRKRSSVVLEIPKYSYGSTMYGNNGAIAAVPNDKPFSIKVNEPDFWVLECPGLRSTLKHANMIALGYSSGKIEFFNPNKFLDKNPDEVLPQLTLSLPKLARRDVLDPAVCQIEVAEVKGAHVLFIVTPSFIHQVSLGYPLLE